MKLNGIVSVLFVGAHTDDEMVCAGSLTKLNKMGAQVHVLTFSHSATSRDRRGGKVARRAVLPEFKRSMGLLKARWRLFNWGTDTLPNKRDAIRQTVFDFVNRRHVDMAFILSPHDDHQAHQVVGEESERVMKGRVATILRCQYPWNYRAFNPNVFVTLSDDEFQNKLAVIQCYKSQMFRYQYADMLGSYTRGDGLSIKHALSEKFELVRCVL